MKMNILFLMSIIFGLIISSTAFSDNSAGSVTPPTSTGSTPPALPCKNITDACISAGKGTSNLELWTNCIKPILHGQTIAGVTVNPADVAACKTKMQEHHKQTS